MRPILLPRRLVVGLLATTTLCAVLSARSAERGANASSPRSTQPQYVCPAEPDGQVYETPGFCGHDERIEKGRTLRVAVVLFKGAQIIDYAGPMEIFGQAGATVFTVAPTKEARTSIFGLNVTPDYDFETAPPADVLLVPGGNIDEIVQSPANKAWLVKRARESEIVLSTCTGAFVLGYAGLLDGLPATTIAPQIKYLKQEFPRITQAVRDRRVVDTGKIITTAGLSAGMDGALHVLERWYGRFDAVEVARGIEYDWHPDRPGSYGELVQHQMPHWPAIVPAGSAWARYHESGDNRRWETRAHVGFGGTPQAYLDHLGSQVLKEGWASAGRRHLSSTFRRSAEGAKWAMTLSLDETHAPDRHDLVVRVTRLGK